jgi:hypothetical protein
MVRDLYSTAGRWLLCHRRIRIYRFIDIGLLERTPKVAQTSHAATTPIPES